MRKDNFKGEEHSELPRDPLGGHSVSSPYQSSSTQLHCVKRTPATTGTTDGKSVWHPVQQYLLQKEFQKTDLSVRAPSSSNSDTVATVVHQIMTELNKAVSEEDRVVVITKLVLNLMEQNGCYKL
jgi:hypothetical protein